MNPPSPPENNRRGLPRAALTSQIIVACYRGWLAPEDLAAAGLLDVAVALTDMSASGARLVVKVDLQAGQEVTLGLYNMRTPAPIYLRGTVVWCLPVEGGLFHAGVYFVQPIPPADLANLV